MVFGDSEGILHQWSDRDSFKVNTYERPLDLAPPPEIPPIDISDHTPLNSVELPFYNEPLLSDWPPNQTYTIGLPSPPIDPEILKSIKQIHFVGYAPNPGNMKRNQVKKKAKTQDRPKFHSEQEKIKSKNLVLLLLTERERERERERDAILIVLLTTPLFHHLATSASFGLSFSYRTKLNYSQILSAV